MKTPGSGGRKPGQGRRRMNKWNFPKRISKKAEIDHEAEREKRRANEENSEKSHLQNSIPTLMAGEMESFFSIPCTPEHQRERGARAEMLVSIIEKLFHSSQDVAVVKTIAGHQLKDYVQIGSLWMRLSPEQQKKWRPELLKAFVDSRNIDLVDAHLRKLIHHLKPKP